MNPRVEATARKATRSTGRSSIHAWAHRVIAVATMMCLAYVAPSRAESGTATVSIDNPALPLLVRGLAIGGGVRVEGVVLEVGGSAVALELARFRVFAPDARIVIHGDTATRTVPPPDHVYLRGAVRGRAGSWAALTVLDGGGLRGLIADRGRFWLAVQRPGEGSPSVEEVTDSPVLAANGRRFACATDLLPDRLPQLPAAAADPPSTREATAVDSGAAHTALVAVETDFEYYHLFGDVTAAASYAADLFAYASRYYTTEVGTEFWVQSISLWASASDPWTQSSSQCGLAEFGRYWNEHHQTTHRTLAHFLSGKPAGGGIAWIGVLCSTGFNVDISDWGCTLTPTTGPYGGDYSFSGDISGNFNIANPSVVWDIYVVSHEIGHNFSSPHTHCYSPPVDQCYGSEGGCYAGPDRLPCGSPGAGCGTIMSYCHLLDPGLSNISLTFGLDHPWGDDPNRVPRRMSDFVAATASAHPACLAPIVFLDTFETGDTSEWSYASP